MADYQVLPPGFNCSTFQSLLTDPNDFQLSESVDDSFVGRQLPTFFPPASFSKFDKPSNYLSPKTAGTVGSEEQEGTTSEATPIKTRPKRVHNIYGLTCDLKQKVPTEPHPQAYGLPQADHPKIEELRVLFEERPVWSRTALQYHVKLPQTFLRRLLSVLCYKFLNIPYKNLWVKLGYDPRTDPSSKIYQAIDYRAPQDVLNMVPESRRGGARGLDTTSFVRTESDDNETTKESFPTKQPEIEETSFIFYPDKFPSQRQIIYQLCDIRDQEVQKLVHANDGHEVQFKESNGWCEEDTYEKIRKILSTRMRALCGVTEEQTSVSTIVDQKKTSKHKKLKSKK